MLILGFRRSYDTPGDADKLSYRANFFPCVHYVCITEYARHTVCLVLFLVSVIIHNDLLSYFILSSLADHNM